MFFERGTIAFFHKWDDKFCLQVSRRTKPARLPLTGELAP